jgi:C1A family cysteine protease
MKKLIPLFFVALILCALQAVGEPTFTLKEYPKKHSLGLKRTKHFEAFKHSLPHRMSAMDTPIPGSYDLTSKVSPPENQGGCGSCWDFSITKALRSALMLVGKDPGVLSFNYLLNNCGPGPKQYGCDGGDFDAGQSMLAPAGDWLASSDPYTQQEGRCKTGLPIAGQAVKWTVVGNGNTPPSFKELAEAISSNHMLSIDVAVCGSWESYQNGVFDQSECGSGDINHMINLVGYSCETSIDTNGNCVFNAQGQPVTGGYLMVMNNWGTDWGMKGYMNTRWGVDAVATDAMYFEVK